MAKDKEDQSSGGTFNFDGLNINQEGQGSQANVGDNRNQTNTFTNTQGDTTVMPMDPLFGKDSPVMQQANANPQWPEGTPPAITDAHPDIPHMLGAAYTRGNEELDGLPPLPTANDVPTGDMPTPPPAFTPEQEAEAKTWKEKFMAALPALGNVALDTVTAVAESYIQKSTAVSGWIAACKSIKQNFGK